MKELNPYRSVVLLSGGMDSTTALYNEQLNSDRSVAAAVSINYGQKHRKELDFAIELCHELDIPNIRIDVPDIGANIGSALTQEGVAIPRGHYADKSMAITVVPMRNSIFLAIAGGIAYSLDAQNVVAAMHAGDHPIYPDCRPSFVQAMEGALRKGSDSDITVRAPFLALDKAAIAELGANLHVPFEKTWSCYVGGEKHCGACGTCVERREAFVLAGITDPTEYMG